VGQRFKRKETGNRLACSGAVNPAGRTRHQKEEKSDALSGVSTKVHLMTATNTQSDISHLA
jgi:hypothetical protein